MFDIGWQELFLIAVVALIVIGPKDMPTAMRTGARALSKVRGLSREFQQGVSEIMREAELDEIRRKVDQAGRVDIKGEVGRMLDPDGRVRSDLDLARDLRPLLPDGEHGAGEVEATSGPPPAGAGATAPTSPASPSTADPPPAPGNPQP